MFLINLNSFYKLHEGYLFLYSIENSEKFSYDYNRIYRNDDARSVSSIRYTDMKSIDEADFIFKIRDTVFMFTQSLLKARLYHNHQDCMIHYQQIKNLIYNCCIPVFSGYYNVKIIKSRYQCNSVEISHEDINILDTMKDIMFFPLYLFDSHLPPPFTESRHYECFNICSKCGLLICGDTCFKSYRNESGGSRWCIFCADIKRDLLSQDDKMYVERDLYQIRLHRPKFEKEWLLEKMKKEL